MLGFCRVKIEGAIEENVKKLITQKKHHLNQVKITLQKLDLQSTTAYQISRNSVRISMDFSDLR